MAAALLIAVAVIAAGCGGQQREQPSTTATAASPAGAAPAEAGGDRARPRLRYATVPLKVPAGNGGGAFSSSRTLTLPRGWTAEVWARVPSARLEVWTPEGALLVSSPDTGDVFELTAQRDRSAPPDQRKLLTGLTLPQGLAFDRLDGHEVLYVAESDQVDRYQWNHGSVGARTVVVRGLPDTQPSGDDVHRLKNVVIGPDHRIYVDIGSASNATPQARSSGPPRASVLALRSDGTHMQVFASGVRNGDGLSFAPDGTLWTAVNERDDISYPFRRSYGHVRDAFGEVIQAYVNDHPPDEIARLTPKRNLGWPFCNPDPDVKPGALGTPFDYGNMRLDADATTNPGGQALNCAKLPRIERGIPAHSAPLGFHFLQGSSLPAPWAGGAVVAAHGSWDREPPRAPAVLWMPWERSKRTLGAAITIVSGFQSPGGGRWGRAVGAVAGPDGALYVSDDTASAIYRIVPSKHS